MFKNRRPEPVVQRGTVWFGPHDVLNHVGLSISSPLIYVGHELPAVHDTGGELEPAVIALDLPVAEPVDDEPVTGVSYAGLSDGQRGSFLHWLAEPEVPPNSPTWAVALQLAALERRLLLDHLHGDFSYEVGTVLARLKALLGVTEDAQVRTALIQLMVVAVGELPASSREYPPQLNEEMSSIVPESPQVLLGWYSAASKPVPGFTLTEAVRALAGASLPTEAHTCPAEFDQLLAIRLEEAGLTDGLADAALEETILEVRPFSRSFKLDIGVSVGCVAGADLAPFVSTCVSVASACGTELAPFARWARRDVPVEAGAAKELLLPEVLGGQQSGAVPGLRDLMETTCAPSNMGDLEVCDIAALWPLAEDIEADPAAQANLTRYLELIGFGLVPDARFGDPLLPGTAVCFRMPEPTSPTQKLLADLEALRIAWRLIVADDVVTDAEVWRLEDRLHADHLDTTPEGMRLLATHAWKKLRSDHGFAGAPGTEAPGHDRLSTLTYADRRSLARLLVALACSDARIVEAELLVLRDAFEMLEISSDTVDSLITSFTGHDATDLMSTRAQPTPKDNDPRTSSEVKFLAAIEAVEAETIDEPAIQLTDEQRLRPPVIVRDAETSTLPAGATEVLAQLRTLETPLIEDAARIARSAGVMWGQISEEINEIAIDLTGELALDEEDGRILLDVSVIEVLLG